MSTSSVMRLPRRVEPEMLDQLPETDPRAIRSRRDLRRINRFMAAQSILCRAIDAATRGKSPRHIVELGAGDGTLLLRVAHRHAAQWPGVEVMMVDRKDLVASNTREGFARLGWTLRVVTGDVFDWLDETPAVPRDLMLANLFLHHFAGAALARLLVIVEQYPNLKANEQFNRLSDELAGTENRIAVERMRYNERVQEYNTSRRQFPGVITAKIFSFKDYPLFEAPPAAQQVPKVGF